MRKVKAVRSYVSFFYQLIGANYWRFFSGIYCPFTFMITTSCLLVDFVYEVSLISVGIVLLQGFRLCPVKSAAWSW